MEENLTEIEILLRVDKLFSNLSTEEIKRIFDFISSKYKIGNKIKDDSLFNKHENLNDKTKSLSTELLIKDFIAQKKPENYYERIACLAYYLEKYKGIESFKTVDITKANLEARLNKLPNPALYVSDATVSYGYLTSVGGGKKALSKRGETVVEALPEREKVDEALKENPFKRRTKKNVKKI